MAALTRQEELDLIASAEAEGRVTRITPADAVAHDLAREEKFRGKWALRYTNPTRFVQLQAQRA